MPTVPLVNTTSVEARTGGGGGYLSVGGAADPDAFGAGIGRAQQQLGATIERSSDVFAKHAEKLQDRANQAWANEAFVESTKALGDQMEWLKNQQGIKAPEALPEFYRKTEDIRQKYLEGAPNMEARRMFDQDLKRRIGFLHVDAGNYAGNQNRNYNINQAKARQEISIQQAANAQDEPEFRNALNDAKIGAATESEELGLPTEQRALHINNAVSRAWASRLASIGMNDPFRAKELYEGNKDQITNPETRLAIEKNIQQQYVSVGSRMDKDSIVNGTPFKSFPNVGGTYREAISTVETGSREGNYQAQGPVVDKGRYAGQRALGRYQIMEGNLPEWSKAAIGREVTKEEFLKNPEIQDQIFDAKFGELVKKYGNPQDAASAWHSGRPLAEATAAGANDGFMRTADYVRKFSVALGDKPAEPLTPNSGPEWLQGAVERAKAIAQSRAPDNPQYEDTLVNRVKTEYNNVRTVNNEVDRGRFNTLVDAANKVDDTGRPAVTSMGQIMDDPQLSAAYNELTATKQESIRKRVEKNSKADVALTPERWTRFQELKGLAITDPKAFADADLNNEDLPRTLQGQLLTQQRTLQKNAQENFGMTRAIASVTPMLNDAGIRRSASDTAVAARYNQFVGAFQAEREQWIKDAGGKLPSDTENQKIAAGVLRVTNEDRWFFQSEARKFEIPQASMDEISKAFRTRYGRDPTAPERYTIYQRQLKREAGSQ